ncbi:MAG: hypothetical protein GAK33_04134 [Burkholderia lata]|uniref:HTH crp-type domain-containing protein n=1 Tax=Burkholderia lata (strain ATCC 17760 / DSM 23089 / LMG 22485 / NCIMB 9086 / R18194 / 383) TaxID=482957 RepID=A0A833V1P2_BURL3|nr:Crp/Fnr family transcriptional regulator [Burkholderia lata]KAF1036131.1 MAG: hypothetical protein GAK33_04134 [Burkholderia lata]
MEHRENNVVGLHSALNTNRFLSALDGIDRRALTPFLNLCHVKAGEVLCDAHTNPAAIFFPVTTAVSIQYLSIDGMTLGVAEIGREGVICTDVVGNWHTVSRRIVVYRGGSAYRLDAQRFADACEDSRPIRRQVFACLQAMLAQIAQTALCSRHHDVRQQLCRWLLVAHERSQSIEIPVTHGVLAQILGVRRETVSDAAQKLQKLGLIDQHRGSVVLTDVASLERIACGCHRQIRMVTQSIPGAEAHAAASSPHRLQTV